MFDATILSRKTFLKILFTWFSRIRIFYFRSHGLIQKKPHMVIFFANSMQSPQFELLKWKLTVRLWRQPEFMDTSIFVSALFRLDKIWILFIFYVSQSTLRLAHQLIFCSTQGFSKSAWYEIWGILNFNPTQLRKNMLVFDRLEFLKIFSSVYWLSAR